MDINLTEEAANPLTIEDVVPQHLELLRSLRAITLEDNPITRAELSRRMNGQLTIMSYRLIATLTTTQTMEANLNLLQQTFESLSDTVNLR